MTFKLTDKFSLHCYVDADFARLWNCEPKESPQSVKSRTRYSMMVWGCPVHWSSKLQQIIALRTVESEYLALSQAMRELLPIREFLQDLQGHMNVNFKDKALMKSTVFE